MSEKSRFVKEIFSYQYGKPTPVIPTVIDPLAVLALFCPEAVIDGMAVKVNIHIQGERTKGCSVIDFFSPEAKNPNSYLIKKFDVERVV